LRDPLAVEANERREQREVGAAQAELGEDRIETGAMCERRRSRRAVTATASTSRSGRAARQPRITRAIESSAVASRAAIPG